MHTQRHTETESKHTGFEEAVLAAVGVRGGYPEVVAVIVGAEVTTGLVFGSLTRSQGWENPRG